MSIVMSITMSIIVKSQEEHLKLTFSSHNDFANFNCQRMTET